MMSYKKIDKNQALDGSMKPCLAIRWHHVWLYDGMEVEPS
uniref:Uncharacterized protein n=1 Tax=Arundo donax TaxID=35708 RepID=A0A0A9H276_ARUDO